MKILLSLPPNLVDSFDELEGATGGSFYCGSDPASGHLGSGGGTAWLLERCRADGCNLPFEAWLPLEKRVIIHAGGQSRRLPAYAPSGKILTPAPVFRWARGQRLDQNLLSLQLPLFEDIMEAAPDGLHTLVASGDVYVRAPGPLPVIADADVVCFGLWSDAALASRHGVFLSRRSSPSELDRMLQKPSTDELARLSGSHLFLMDIGIWLLSDRAVTAIARRSGVLGGGGRALSYYDMYAQFGGALGANPLMPDDEINGLSVKIIPLPGGEFYHYGTGRELISSTLAAQNIVRDQRAIMHRYIKPHPAMFVQNAEVKVGLRADNSELWIENSFVGPRWRLSSGHIITGVPENDWELALPPGVCVDAVPVGDSLWAARPYGIDDRFSGCGLDASTLFMGAPLSRWAGDRGVSVEGIEGDIQNAGLFPVCSSVDELGLVIRWMTGAPGAGGGKGVWERLRKLSAAGLMRECNLRRLFEQRRQFRRGNWPGLAQNHAKSVFYQIDLDHAASEFAGAGLALPDPLEADAPVMKQIHNRMMRARALRFGGLDYEGEERLAFGLLREGMIAGMGARRELPRLCMYSDQIAWARSPVRIDLAGGWTDTPPYCLYAGGAVVNIAVELNGQPPLQVYVKPSPRFEITLRSIDLGATEAVRSWGELGDYNKVGSPFSIPRAALALAGFMPEFSAKRYSSLEDQLRDFGSGLEITLLSAIPAGSGLGTSSILAATALGALSDCCGLGWDRNEIGNRTLLLEQLLTTGGGWQDQFGGILHGLKLLQTGEGFNQSPLVRWLPGYIFTDPEYRSCHLLYYTGITRTAKDILSEIVRGMFLNSCSRLRILEGMKRHALDMFDAIQQGSFERYGRLVLKTWEQNKALDSGVNPPAIERLVASIADYSLGYKLPGAGGGGYLYIVAKDPLAAGRIRQVLTSGPLHRNARFVEMGLSDAGLAVSRS
jgi:galactokinase/mevalonate kinase-like predicted kinase